MHIAYCEEHSAKILPRPSESTNGKSTFIKKRSKSIFGLYFHSNTGPKGKLESFSFFSKSAQTSPRFVLSLRFYSTSTTGVGHLRAELMNEAGCHVAVILVATMYVAIR